MNDLANSVFEVLCLFMGRDILYLESWRSCPPGMFPFVRNQGCQLSRLLFLFVSFLFIIVVFFVIILSLMLSNHGTNTTKTIRATSKQRKHIKKVVISLVSVAFLLTVSYAVVPSTIQETIV